MLREYEPKRENESGLGPVREVAFGLGDRAIAIVHDFGVGVMDRSNSRYLANWSSPPGGNAVAFDPDGTDRVGGVRRHGRTRGPHGPAAAGPAPDSTARGGSRGSALSPDGRTALITGADGITRLWDLATGRVLGPPLALEDIVAGVFSRDGRRIVIAVCDGRIGIYDLPAIDKAPPPTRRATGSSDTPASRSVLVEQNVLRTRPSRSDTSGPRKPLPALFPVELLIELSFKRPARRRTSRLGRTSQPFTTVARTSLVRVGGATWQS